MGFFGGGGGGGGGGAYMKVIVALILNGCFRNIKENETNEHRIRRLVTLIMQITCGEQPVKIDVK